MTLGGAASLHAGERAGVAVVRTVAWSPGDMTREGADELAVLMHMASVQRQHRLAGLVGVGNTNGSFLNGEERALRFAALSGVPVMKVSTRGAVAHCPDELFIEADALPEAEACKLLADALERCGAPPRAANPAQPTASELAAIAGHVQRMREHIAVARGIRVAME